MSLQFFAPAGVKPARDKKERDDGEVDEVSHTLCFQTFWSAAGSEAPRRFYIVGQHPKAVSPLRSATALQNPRSISCAHSAIRAAAGGTPALRSICPLNQIILVHVRTMTQR
jgi:hypothetical protein